VLGHAATFHLDLDQDDVVGEPPNYNYLDERQANQFAAALLMDERWVRADFARGMRTPYELAQRYDVSETAMSYRLVNLRLL
jgi:Zn-dependent peptidase ImmA (M78 family)